MSSLPTPPRIGPRVPLPPPPREGTANDDPNELLRPGDLLEGRYQVEERIGEGGIGLVYRAVQLKLHRRVAVKLLQQETLGEEDLRPRFEREAVALAALSHPNIVSLTDYGIVRGRPFLVMELLEGRTLREALDTEGAFAAERALGLTRQLVHALAYAHERGIVHRDLKPANIIVQSLPDQPEHLKILDFGLVKFLPGSNLDPGVQLSRVGFTFGTPAYMSPEHAAGGPVDGRADLYSAGILLFEMLTNTKPYDGELDETLRAHFTQPIPRLADRRPELAGRADLQALIDRALAKNRDDRFANAAEFLVALDAARLSPERVSGAPGAVPPPREDATIASGPLAVTFFEQNEAPLARRSLHESLRARAEPLLGRAKETLSQLVTRTRELAHAAGLRSWAFTQPRLVRALDGIARVALSAKTRLEAHPPSLLPPPAVDETQPEGDSDGPAA